VADHDLTALLTETCRDAPADVVAVYIFGSLARGAGTSQSDVDVAVLLREPVVQGPSAATEALLDRLERAARRTVDLVVLNGAAPDLTHRVLRDGVLVLDRDRSRRLRFEVQARNEYFDLEPIRRAYRRTGAADGRS
jgi:predicted nucleotidyltransferase